MGAGVAARGEGAARGDALACAAGDTREALRLALDGAAGGAPPRGEAPPLSSVELPGAAGESSAPPLSSVELPERAASESSAPPLSSAPLLPERAAGESSSECT